MSGRQPISDGMKAKIASAFNTIPDDKRGALVILADEQGARVHVAAKLSDGWKIAAGAGRTWQGNLTGEVAIVGVW